MGRKEEIIEAHGIPVDDRTVTEKAMVAKFAEKGVPLHEHTVYRLRVNTTSGDKLKRRLDGAELLKGNSAKKDKFYRDLASAGIKHRTFNGGGRFSSVNYMDHISNELNVDIQDVRRSLRAMRADLILSQQESNDPEFFEVFCRSADQYLAQFINCPDPSKPLIEVSRAWDRDTIEAFYRYLYQLADTTQTRKTWPPYEARILESFYDKRLTDGSPLTVLDRMTLNKNISGSPLPQLVQEVRVVSGVPYDGVVHFTHTNALLYGQPTRPREEFTSPVQTLLVDAASPVSSS